MYAPEEKYRTAEAFALMVEDAFNFADDNRSKREKHWRRNKMLYDNKTDLSHFRDTLTAMPYEDQVNLPTAFEKVEATMPMVVSALLGNSPMCRVKPREEDDRAAAMAVQGILDYQFEEDLDIRTQLPLLLRDSLIYDTKIAYVGWRAREHAAGKRFDPHTGKHLPPMVRDFDWDTGKEVKAEDKSKPQGHPWLKGLERWNFYEDPLGMTINGFEGSCRFAIWRRIMTPDQLEQWVESTRGIGKKEAKAQGIKPRTGKPWNMTNCRRAYKMTGTVQIDDDFGVKLRRDTGLRASHRPGDYDDRLLEVLCYYEDEVWGVVIRNAADDNGKSGPMCLLREPNPFWHGLKPFVAFRYVQLDNQFDGKALLDVIRDLCLEKNTRRQQRMDEVDRAINSWLFYNRSQVNGDDLISRVGGKIPVRGIPSQAVHSFRSQPIGQNAYQEAAMIDQEIDRTSGLTPPLQGTGGGGTDTARGIAMFIQQGTNRFKLEVEMYSRSMRSAAVMVHELDRQYLPIDGVVRLLGRTKAGGWGFQKWTLKDVRRNFDFEFTCSPEEANQAMWRQNLVNGLAVLSPANAQRPFLDWPEIALAFFESMGYRGDSERFLIGDMEDVDAENAAFLMTGGFPPGAPGDPKKHIDGHVPLLTDGSLGKLPAHVDRRQAMQRLRAHLNDHGEKLQPQGQRGGMAPAGQRGAAG